MEVVLGDNFNTYCKLPDQSNYHLVHHSGKCWKWGNWVVHTSVVPKARFIEPGYTWVGDKGKYTITHNPTGIYIDQNFTNSKKAIEAMKLYQEAIDPYLDEQGNITSNYEAIIAIRRKVYEEYK